MKKIILSLTLIFGFIFSINAQSPLNFKYQAVARDAQNQPYQNQTLSIRLSVVEDNGTNTGTGILRYSETHLAETSDLGLFSVSVFDGDVQIGEFDDLNWASHSYWLKVEMDENGGDDFKYMGKSPLLSVPYALHAKTVENADDADADPTNEIQNLTFDENLKTLSLSNGNTVDLGILAGGGGGSDDQNISLSGTILSIEDGNSVDLSILQDGVNDPDSDPTNEFQNLTLNGTEISISNGNKIDLNPIIPPGGTDDQNLILNGTNLEIESGNSIDLSVIQDGNEDADADPNNELQTLSFNPTTNQLSLSNGNSVIIPTGGTDADADPTNEIQSLSLNGTELSISDGNSLDLSPILPTGGTDDQNLILTGTILNIESGNSIDLSVLQDGINDADADPNNEIQTLSKNGNIVSLSNSGGSFTDEVNDADSNPQNELQNLTLIGTEISISNGNSIDLNPILPPGGTDDQNLILNGTNLEIEDGNIIDLSVIQDGVNDSDSDPNNEIQILSKNGNIVSLSDGGSFTDEVNDADSDNQNEIQDLNLAGTNLSISNGNSVDLSVIQDGFEDADADPNNEIQTLSKNGNTVTLSNGGGSFTDAVNDADSDDQNEIQDLNLAGTNLSISNGNSVDLSVIQDGFEDADADPNNEIQTLSKNGNTVTLSNGGGSFTDAVNDADSDDQNEIQDLNLSGTNLSISNGNSVDLSGLGSLWSSSSNEIYYDNGKVAIGFDDPVLSSLEVMNDFTIRRINKDATIDMYNSPSGAHFNMHNFNKDVDVKLQSGTATGGKIQLSKSGDLRAEINVDNSDYGALSLKNNSNTNSVLIKKVSGSNTHEILLNENGSPQLEMRAKNTGAEVKIKKGNGDFGINLNGGSTYPSLSLFKTNALAGVSMSVNQDGGLISCLGNSNYSVAKIGRKIGSPGDGEVTVGGSGEPGLSKLTVSGISSQGEKSGKIELYSTNNNNLIFELGGWGSWVDYADMRMYDYYGNLSIHDSAEDFGAVRKYYSEGNLTVRVRGDGDGGNITIYDDQEVGAAGIYSNLFHQGVIWGDIKNFRMEHPTQPDKEIWYACIEGPEAAAYERGTAKLENGEAFVPFSEHFQLVANPETMTVIVTPLSADTYGLAVVEKLPNGFKIKELAKGKGSFEFDWEVKCVRKGYENYEVVRDAMSRD